MNIVIRKAESEDIDIMLSGFTKNKSTFEEYFKEQKSDERIIWLAYFQGEFAGYVTLKWHSEYESFKSLNIPEIKDLNVLPDYRKNGIATKLIQATEQEVSIRGLNVIGLGVGLFMDYGAAQRLYFRLGYQPDGRGVIFDNKISSYGDKVILDDELCLFLTKNLN